MRSYYERCRKSFSCAKKEDKNTKKKKTKNIIDKKNC